MSLAPSINKVTKVTLPSSQGHDVSTPPDDVSAARSINKVIDDVSSTHLIDKVIDDVSTPPDNASSAHLIDKVIDDVSTPPDDASGACLIDKVIDNVSTPPDDMSAAPLINKVTDNVSTAPLIDKATLPSQGEVLDSATTIPGEAGDVTQSGEGSVIANQEPEVELFLHRITDQLKWQELVSKWLRRRTMRIKGYFYL